MLLLQMMNKMKKSHMMQMINKMKKLLMQITNKLRKSHMTLKTTNFLTAKTVKVPQKIGLLLGASDPDVLDCPIYFDPLSIPVYQCDNGHIACSACCFSIGKKCATCSLPIGSNRCRAFENVLESVKISCPYAKYGCKETLSYSEKNDHELGCIHVPCSCPHMDCDFVGSYKELYRHFSRKHQASREKFSYDRSFSVTLKSSDEVIVLQEKTDGTLFILHSNVMRLGNAVNISRIGPNSSKLEYNYYISARSQGSSLKLESLAKDIQRSILGILSSRFLLIPFGYFRTREPRYLDICIGSNEYQS